MDRERERERERKKERKKGESERIKKKTRKISKEKKNFFSSPYLERQPQALVLEHRRRRERQRVARQVKGAVADEHGDERAPARALEGGVTLEVVGVRVGGGGAGVERGGGGGAGRD